LRFTTRKKNGKEQNAGNGGSGGARTRIKMLQIQYLGGLPSQGASQISGALGHDLTRVVTAWDKLPSPLKAAILAIVNTAANVGGL
jgi:hypothetical protein